MSINTKRKKKENSWCSITSCMQWRVKSGNRREAHKFKNSISSYVNSMTMNDEDDSVILQRNVFIKCISQPNSKYCAAKRLHRTAKPTDPTNHPTIHSVSRTNETIWRRIYYWITIFIIISCKIRMLQCIHVTYMHARIWSTIGKRVKGSECEMWMEQTNSLTHSFSSDHVSE